MKTFLLRVIKIYQKIFSPFQKSGLLGFYAGCRFYPSCSEYSAAAIEKYGAVAGAAKSIWRVLRCGPWSRGGVNLP